MQNENSYKPMVSVIMPTYNHSAFISKAIESVLKQTYANFELIIIDNYSSDQTQDVVAKFCLYDNRIKYHKFNNEGVIANSRNYGMTLSSGELIAFLDSDDMWDSNKLSRQVPIFRSDEVGLVYCGIRRINSDNVILGLQAAHRITPRRELVQMLNFEVNISTSTVIVKKRILLNNNLMFRSGRQGAEDWDLWLRIANVSRIDCIEDQLVSYREHIEATSKDYEMMLMSTIKTLDDFEKYICNNSLKFDNLSCIRKACQQSRVYAMQKFVHESLSRDRCWSALVATLHAVILMPLSFVCWKFLMKIILIIFYRPVKLSLKMLMGNKVLRWQQKEKGQI